MFSVPNDDDDVPPPSTPDLGLKSRNQLNVFSASNPSTTPAAPPPTSMFALPSATSTTPAGPPPSSLFGSLHSGAPIPFPSSRSSGDSHLPSSPPDLAHHGMGNGDASDPMDQDQPHPEAANKLSDFTSSLTNPRHTAQALNIHQSARAFGGHPAPISNESDDLVFDTVRVIEDVSNGNRAEINSALPQAVAELLLLWQSHEKHESNEIPWAVPSDQSDPIFKANFLSTLLLRLHHPPRKPEPSTSLRSTHLAARTKPIPAILLDWLREHHNPYHQEFEDIMNTKPNCTAHDRFWEAVLSLQIRGEINKIIQLFQAADFSKTYTKEPGPNHQPGYHGKQLGNIQHVIQRAAQVLEQCPAIQGGKWDIKGSEWSVFRKRVSSAVSDLETFSEKSRFDRSSGTTRSMEADNFGGSGVDDLDSSLSRVSRRATSMVPWPIYENLSYLYSQLLGVSSEIDAASSDWIEAVIGMAVWWNGDDINEMQQSFRASRRSYRNRGKENQPPVSDSEMYQARLAYHLDQFLDENRDLDDAQMQIKPTSAVQIGLANVISGNVEGVIEILSSWSSTIAAAVMEVADLGGWLDESSSRSDLTNGFDASNLMVLDFAQHNKMGIDKYRLLANYAEELADRGTFEDSAGNVRKGWQLAASVVSRVRNEDHAKRLIGEILERQNFTDSREVDETVFLCNRIGLHQESQRICARYSEWLMDNTQQYGDAIIQFARAGQPSKVKEVVDLLSSLSLVQSMAYPPNSGLDVSLKSLVVSPQESISHLTLLSSNDKEQLLGIMSGYATLRRFYELRDEELLVEMATEHHQNGISRKREAAAALVAVIMSSADGIHGGLYDESVKSSMQIDGLLVLLGEALAFVNQYQPFLTIPQTFAILKAAEDLSTVSPRIRHQCEECLKSALAYANGSDVPWPSSTFRSTSGLSASSQFSLIGSEMLSRSRTQSSASRSSGMLVQSSGQIKRGWDWRKGLDVGAKGDDVLKMLRFQVAREISRGWIEG